MLDHIKKIHDLSNDHKIAIIGLGYVGLPLAVEFGKFRPVIGFDIDVLRVKDLGLGKDATLELSSDELKQASELTFSANPEDLRTCTIFIVTVPTPVDKANRPDLMPLVKASHLVGEYMPRGSLIIYESTVYPGATEEICVPALEMASKKIYNKDFFVDTVQKELIPVTKSTAYRTS